MRALLTLGLLASAAVPLAPNAAEDWQDFAMVSTTMGTQVNRLCAGADASDLGCPSYAPSLTTAGHVSVTGNLSAVKFIGDGSELTGLTTSGDRITSGTSSIIVSQSGHISFTTAGTERMVIDAAGNVGIGTTEAGALLDLENTDNTDTAGNGHKLRFTTGTTGLFGFRMDSLNNHLVLDKYWASWSPALAINRNTGNVGIGTTSPQAALHVSASMVDLGGTGTSSIEVGRFSAGNQYSYIDLTGDDTYTDFGLRLMRGNTGANAASTLHHRGTGSLQFYANEQAPLTFTTSSTERLRITPAGDIGIGVNAPSSKLHIRGATSNIYLGDTLEGFGSGTTWSGGIYFGPWGGTASHTTAGIEASWGEGLLPQIHIGTLRSSTLSPTFMSAYYTGQLAFTTLNSERMRINNVGNVGIGTTSPQATLQVSGSMIVSTSAQVTTPSLYVGTNGNVGIGKTAPDSKFFVHSGSTPDNALAFELIDNEQPASLSGLAANWGGALSYNMSGGQSDFDFINRAPSSNAGMQGFRFIQQTGTGTFADLMTMNGDNGSVGIGTTTPQKTLDVSGTAQIASRTLVGGTGTPSGTMHVSGTLFLAGDGGQGCNDTTVGIIRRPPTTGRLQVCK